jgi:processive 1,2-diacylglycerol beta-glucosyltransferase
VGHLSAANAVSTALRSIDPDGQTMIVDSYEYAALVVSRVVADGYLRMVKTIPQMYRYIYDRAERATEVGRFRTWAHQFTAGNLRPLILHERPDVVVCTHAFPCGAMAEYKREFPDAPPVVAIVTDFAVHGFWLHEDIDHYIVANDEVRSAIIQRGIRPDAVSATGIPIRPEFGRRDQPADPLRERLDLPRDRRIALLMGGGLGIAPLERMLAQLDAVRQPLAAVVIAGRNPRRERRLLTAAESVNYPVRALQFVDNVYDYMHAADVLVTKPGGLTTAEALAAAVPIVLCKPLPGQEERNARVLLEGGAALRTRKIAALPTALDAIFSDPLRRSAMIAAAARLARPNAAAEAAAIVAGVVRAQKEIVA